MRFDDLFADLEAQASAQAQRELWDEAQELSRAERGRLDLGDRLRAGRQWRLRLAGGHGCAGRLLRVEADCLVLDQGGEQWCLQLAAVRSALAEGPGSQEGAGVGIAPATGAAAQLERGGQSLRAMLRRASRHRPPVKALVDDGSVYSARLMQVGQDHAELRGDEGTLVLGLAGVSAWVLEPLSGALGG